MQNFSSIDNKCINYSSYIKPAEPHNYIKNTHFSSPPSFEKNPDNIKTNSGYYKYGNATLATKMSQTSVSKVSKIFFIKENIKRLQKKIRREIYNKTNGKFRLDVDQDENDLQIVMNKINEEYGRNLPSNLIHQVKELNSKTIEYIIPDILTNIKQHYGYIKDISTPLQPIPRPMQVRTTNRQSLPSITSLWEYKPDNL